MTAVIAVLEIVEKPDGTEVWILPPQSSPYVPKGRVVLVYNDERTCVTPVVSEESWEDLREEAMDAETASVLRSELVRTGPKHVRLLESIKYALNKLWRTA